MKKMWIMTEIYNHAEQIMSIQPTPEYDGIEIYTKELNGKSSIGPFYISKDELPIIIKKLEEMMEYVLEK